jgi:hypothetical protein
MFMLFAFVFGPQQASAVVKTTLNKQGTEYFLDITPEDLQNKSFRTLKKEAGKSLTLKEKFTLRVLKKQLKKSKLADLDAAYAEAKTNTNAIIGFVAAVAPFFFVFVPFVGIALVAISLIFSIMGLKQINAGGGKQRGKGLAIAGIVISGLAIFTALALIALALSVGF